MKAKITFLLLTILSISCTTHQGCYNPKSDEKYRAMGTRLSSPFTEDLPASFSWTNVYGKDFTTQVKNQHIPQYCGSCWAQAATSALSDRIKIARNGQGIDVNMAPQVLISCENTLDENNEPNTNGCHGGSPLPAYDWIKKNYITDESCTNYQARGKDNGLVCSAMIKCKECHGFAGFCFVPPHNTYTISDFGYITGEESIKQEIKKGGPVACFVYSNDEWHNYQGGILDQKDNDEPNHVVTVVGWGEETDGSGNVVKYWIIKNSWGTYWGEEGHIRLIRGKDASQMESSGCAWATPVDTWTTPAVHIPTAEEQNDPNNKHSVGYDPNDVTRTHIPVSQKCRFDSKNTMIDYERYATNDDLPETIDWRNKDGNNYCSPVKNQHIPIYCGSCWAQATTSVLSDRINIVKGSLKRQISLSTQVVVNCQGGGSCHGGWPEEVFAFAKNQGIPDDSCQQYTARDPRVGVCTDMQVCQECKSDFIPGPEETGRDEHCYARLNPRKYYVKNFGYLQGASQMKKELQFGPIECGIGVTDTLYETYKGGIYQENSEQEINHSVSVVGYGVENGVEYWIIRNSWGTWWGEQGFLRIRMHRNNLRIEEDCHWADIDELRSEL